MPTPWAARLAFGFALWTLMFLLRQSEFEIPGRAHAVTSQFIGLFINPNHSKLPLVFSFTNMLLLLFLFPMLFVLVELLEADHTMDLLDTTIMIVIFLLLIVLLLDYGSSC